MNAGRLTPEQVQLWQNYAAAKHALLEAGLIRSYKSTEADFAEWLVALALGGDLHTSQANPSFDVTTQDKRIQVRSYTKMPNNPNGYLLKPADRNNNPETGATHYAFVCFERLIPKAIFLMSEEYVRTFPRQQILRRDLDQTPHKLPFDLNGFNPINVA